MTTETFQIPGTIRTRFTGTYNYSLRTLIPHIIKHYASGHPEHVQERMIRASQKTPMYSGLITKIQRLNWQIVRSGARIRITSKIRIPTAYEFFSSFFPIIDLTIERRGTIRLKTCANGVLDQFHYAIELENIAGNPGRTLEFVDLTEVSQMLIRDAFHTLRIYTSPNNPETDRIQDAIKVFEEEYMQRLPDYRTGMIDSELLMEMNTALAEDGWRRDPFFRNVNDDTRYIIEPLFLTVANVRTEYTGNTLAFFNAMANSAREAPYSAQYLEITETKERWNKETEEYEEYQVRTRRGRLETYCNVFLFNMIFSHFGNEIGEKIFRRQWTRYPPQANAMFATFARDDHPYMERILVDTTSPATINTEMGRIQDMANAGDIVIMAFQNNPHGHVAFVGSEEQTINSVIPRFSAERHYPNERENDNEIARLEGRPAHRRNVLMTRMPILVHAGTYSGVTQISLGVQGWSHTPPNPDPRTNLLQNVVRFYRVRME